MIRCVCNRYGCAIPEHWVIRGNECEQRFEHVAPAPVGADKEE